LVCSGRVSGLPAQEIGPWQALSCPIDRYTQDEPRMIRKTVVQAALLGFDGMSLAGLPAAGSRLPGHQA
jgi:hypothetical protein